MKKWTEIKIDKYDLIRALERNGFLLSDLARFLDVTPECISRRLKGMNFTKIEWKAMKEWLGIEED